MRWRGLAVALALAALATGCTGYVSLGDSYTAGPWISDGSTGPPGCLRSDRNYPTVVRGGMAGTGLRDSSCSGATTREMSRTQALSGWSNPPQMDALSRDTGAVSLLIGANDVGLVEAIASCTSRTNRGAPCRDRFIVAGHDTLAERTAATATKVDSVIRSIRSRAPGAKVFVLGYPAILPDRGGSCLPQMPLTDGDVAYFRDKERGLNAVLQWVAVARGGIYVDTYGPSIGRDTCTGSSTRWIEPVVPTNPAAPVHPNRRGEKGMAAVLLDVMHRSGL